MNRVEEWRDISEYQGYQVSNFGRIKSLYGWNGHKIVEREKILKPSIQYTKRDYKRYVIKLNGRTCKVHRLVAQAFIPNPNNYNIINHIDCNPLNNKVDNLEWCSQKQNIAHSIANHRNKRYYYFDKQLAEELFKQGNTAREISEHLNASKGAIQKALSKKNITRLEYPRASKYGISINEFKMLFKNGVTNREISIKYNIPSNYVARRRYQIKKGVI